MAVDPIGLRPWHVDDAPVLVAAWTDPQITRWSAVPPDTSLEYATRWIAGSDIRRQRWLSLDLAVVEDGAAGEVVVGEVGLTTFDPRARSAQVGYWVAADARGRGIATTAVGLVSHWALRTFRLRAVEAHIDTGNRVSSAVAESCDFVPSQDPGVWLLQSTEPQ